MLFQTMHLANVQVKFKSLKHPYRIFSVMPGNDEIALRLYLQGGVKITAIRHLSELIDSRLQSSPSFSKTCILEIGSHVGTN